jgi:regulatory protein
MSEVLTIIKITTRENHIKIDLDNGESLKIPNKISNNFDLSLNRGIEILEYQQLKDESERYNCMDKALSYLAIKDRSKFEIEKYLKKKDFSHNIIKEVVSQIVDLGYINDYDYAVKYAKELKRKKSVGVNIIKNKLYSKGIGKDKIKKALNDSGAYETDIEQIFNLAMKKYNSYKDKKNYQSRLYFFLNQRGFEKDTIEQVLNMISDELKDI